MWHEARKQEKKIRGLMVDFKKRAERRREFYERIKLDPTQFLRLQGRPMRIHIDHAVAMAAESPQSMMPWRGHTDNMIDRFDVRANLDIIPENVRRSPVIPTKAEAQEERICSYESYRTLVENEAAGLSEEQCLYQIYVDEQFGPVTKVGSTEDEKKKLSEKKAAIGFSYDESAPPGEKEKEGEGSEDEESSDTDVETADLDVTLDVDLLTLEQMDLLNQCAHQFGMKEDDYISLLTKDKEEMESLRQAKMLEEEKAQFSGRKSRRERRAFKEKKMAGRKISPPSYAARESPKQTTYEKKSSSSSRSRSRSPERPTKVLFITSFGGESEEEAGPVQGPQLPAPANDNTSKSESRHNRRNSDDKSRRGENSRSSRKGNSRSRSPRRATSRSRSPRRATSRSRSPRRATSRSRSPGRRRRGRSRSASGSPRGRHYSDRRRSRSRSPLRHNRSPAKGYRRNYGYSSGRGRSRSRSRSRSKDKGKQPQASKQPASQTSRTKSRSKSSSRSRSSSYSSSRSRSSRSRSKSRAHSKSHSPNGNSKPVIKRYRRPSLSSGSGDESDGSDSKDSDVKPKGFVPAPGSGNTVAALQLTKSAPKPMDRLKRRMQAALNRQYKADKKAEQVRTVKMEQERMEREEEMRSRMLEIRRKERERRHLERERDKKSGRQRHSGSDSDSSSDDSGPARRRSRSPSPKHRRQRSRSRSRSRGRSERASRDEGRSERRSRDEGRGDRAWGGDGGRSERTSRDDQDRERRPRSSNY